MHPAPISPIGVALIIFGIFMLAIPPLGVALIIIGIFVNRSYRRSRRGYQREARQKLVDRADREFITAAKGI